MNDQITPTVNLNQIESDSPMDEFSTTTNLKGQNLKKNKIKPLYLVVVLGIAIILVIGIIFIVTQAISKTGTTNSVTVITTPSPLPVVQTSKPIATPLSELPQDWQDTEKHLNIFYEKIQQPNEDRAKLNVPNLNLDTNLSE